MANFEDQRLSALYCSYCDFRCYSQLSLLKHVRDLHANDPNFSVSCSLCGKVYKKWCSFKKHLHRRHDADGEFHTVNVVR